MRQLLADAAACPAETPFFYAGRDVLTRNYAAFAGAFESCEVFYALKANPHPSIIDSLASVGAGFEAASLFEIEAVLSAGVPPESVIYGTAIKPANQIAAAVTCGIERFAADCHEELEKLAQVAPGSRVFVRAKVEDAGSVFPFSERFGAPLEDIKDLVLAAPRLGLNPHGISFHVGSQSTQMSRWAQAAASIRPIVEQLAAEDVVLETLNIGGGFPADYANHSDIPLLHEIMREVEGVMDSYPYRPRIVLEPGRGIVATAVVLVASVIARVTRAGRTWLVLDAGTYNALYEAMAHQGRTIYHVHPAQQDAAEDVMSATLAGPTGDTMDVIARDVPLPSSTKVGDRLIFESAGAYTLSVASTFNGFAVPKLHMP